MPDNQLPGILEDFIGFLVPQGDLLWTRAADCLKSIPLEQRRFTSAKQAKAHIHTWLAWQEEPGTPFGSAITKRYLDADALHAQKLMNWVKRLFDLPRIDSRLEQMEAVINQDIVSLSDPANPANSDNTETNDNR